MEQVLQRRVEHPVSRQVLAGTFAEGDAVRVDLTDGEYTFAKVEHAAAVA